ncbi:MAG: oligosaccharide flippase family protein [Flavobacteriales bacterium]|nr:oligosaccharide flippase family protein [Flavobacteriales bacterium]
MKLNFNSINPRSKKLVSNIAASFGFKAIDILSNLLLVPILLNYLGEAKYGVWLTISSALMWFFFFDVGLGNGLRNKLTEATAQHNRKLAKSLISTAYLLVTAISCGLLIVFIILHLTLDWSVIFNVENELVNDLGTCLLIVFSFGCAQFVLKLLQTIYTSNQQPAYASGINSIGMLISVLCLYWASLNVNDGSLATIGLIFSGSNFGVIIIATIYAFSFKFKEYRPSFSAIRFEHTKSLLGLGIRFFILQMGGLVVLYSDNMIISQILGPTEVTPFNIAFKYFKLITVIFGIITYPFWSAYTEAYVNKDNDWIRRTNKKLVVTWLGLCVVGVVMLFSAEWIYSIWVGNKIQIPFRLSLYMMIFALLTSWIQIYVNFINALGKIKLQIIIGIIEALINIPLPIYLANHLSFGSSGVILATVIIIIPACILLPIQYHKLVNNTAKGIWHS